MRVNWLNAIAVIALFVWFATSRYGDLDNLGWRLALSVSWLTLLALVGRWVWGKVGKRWDR